ncbi:MAG: hypothetical protein IJW52_05900 [Clostridia bacterium]|nr:hypothetical protein [Clostridia bacterium]
MKRYFLLIIMLLLALCLFTSCASCKDDGLDRFEQLIVSTSSSEDEGEAFANAIYVVIPRSSGFELVARAQLLADAVAEKTGIATFLKYDSEQTVEGTFEILVGYTSRLVTKENFSTLRDGDYICRYDRGYIILGGRTEVATVEAIDKFESDILPGASYAAIMSKDAHFEVYAEHGIDEFTLNGYPIYEYTIAYCKESYEIADVISKYVKKNSGYTLSGKQKDSYDPQMSRCIWLVLDPMGDNAASIAARDGNIVLSAPDLCGLSLAATAFASQLGEELSNASAHVQIEGSVVLSYTTRGVDISFGFVDNTGKKDFALLMAIADAVNMSKSDLICFYPSKNSLVKHIELNCPTTHTYLAVEIENDMTVPVLYNSAALSSVSTERRDGSVWVNATANDGKIWRVRIYDSSKKGVTYHSDEIFVLSDLRLGDGNIDRIATVKYGPQSEKIERLFYGETVICTKSETVTEYSGTASYCGLLSLEIIERYHESFIILKDTLK